MKSNLLEETNLLKNFNFIKAILMILVIFGHSIDFWSGNWFTCNPIIPSMFLNVLQKWINSFHIYAFTIISGFIFAFLMKKKHYNCFKKFLNNKVRRLLIPYFFAALLWVMPISQLFYHLNIFEIIEKYLLCIDPAQLWFLWMLFWCFVIHWFLYPYISKNIFYGLSISIICFCIGFVGIRTIDNIFCIFTSLMYIPFFIFGIYLYEIKDFRYIFSKIPFFFIFIVNIFAFCLSIFWNI